MPSTRNQVYETYFLTRQKTRIVTTMFSTVFGHEKTMVKEFFEKKCSTIGLGQLLWRDSKIQLPFSKIDVTFDRKIVLSWLTTHLRAGNMSYNFYINTMGRFSSELWKFFRFLAYIWNFLSELRQRSLILTLLSWSDWKTLFKKLSDYDSSFLLVYRSWFGPSEIWRYMLP